METFRNSVQAVTRDTTETNRILAELLQLTVELVGIETGTLISYAGRLMAAGLSAEEAITAIRGVTERIAEQGKSASVTARVMEQLTQSFNAGIATMQDFRPILREMPTFWRDASNALGVQITNLEDFRQAADAAGGNTQALLLVLAEMGRASEGANLDTLNAQIDILSDQARLLQAELGEHLIPAIVAIAKEVNVWIERFRNMDDRAQAAIAWAIALTTALTGLSVIVGAATLGFGALSASLAAITGVAGVAGLTAGIGGLTAAFVAAAPFIAVGGIIVGGIALLAKAIRDTSESAQVLRTEIKRLDEVTRVYNLTTGQLEVVTASQSEAFAVFQQRVKNAQDDVGNISNLLRQNRMEQEGLNKAMAVASGDAIPALQLQLRGLEAEGQELSQALDDATNKLQGLQFEVAPDESTLTDPIESLEEQLVRAVDQVIRLRDSFSELSRSEDIQAIESAASNLTGALRRELALQLMDAELTAAERLDLQLSIARAIESVERDVQARITAINKDNAEAQADAVQRQTDARIESAERARGVEVAANEAAAASGAAYAEQLARIASPSQRQAYIDIVESFQAQGLSLDEARRRAEPYLEILVAVSSPIHAADQAFGDFTSNLVRGANESASAIGSLMTAVDALGTSIRENLPDTAGSLERSLLNEQRYNEQNPVGRTLDDIQGEAGEQGRNFVNRLFRRQDSEAEKAAIEAQRESIQLYNDLSDATVDFTSSLIDLQEETNLADHAFQDFLGTFGRLATGDFTALLDIPIQLLNISRQAAAEREQGARDRAARYSEQLGDFSRFERNLNVAGGILGIPESPETRNNLFFDPAANFENVLAQSTADFSDGIKNALLASVINLERDIRPEDIVEIFQSSIDALGETLSQSQFNLDFDEQLGRDTTESYNALISDTTAFYQAQIDNINLVRQTLGHLEYGDQTGLARQLQAETNRLHLAAPPSGPQNAQQFLAQNNIMRGLAPGQDDQERGVVFDTPEEAAAEAAAIAAGASEALQTQIANRVANEALGAIREAGNDVNATTASIVEAWEAAQPEVETWYQELLDDANAIENEAERNEAIAALGTLPEFVATLKSQYVTPTIARIEQSAEALQTRTANRLAQDALSAVSEAAGDVNVTEAEINRLWQEAIPSLETWWTELYDDIVNNPNLSDAQQSEDLAALGSQQDFVSRLKSQYVTPVISGIQQAAEALQTRTANRLANKALGAISEAASDANVTEAEIVDLWDASIPALETWYQELLDDANAIKNEGERDEAIAALGTPEAFIANLKSQYVTPVISSIRSSAEALETRTANRLANEALGAIREAGNDVNITEAAILALWNTAIPALETWYQELLDDANAIENEGLRDEAIADLGSPEAFVANLRSQYVTPILTGIQRSQAQVAQEAAQARQAAARTAEQARQAAEQARRVQEALETRTANRLAQEVLGAIRTASENANVTEAEIASLWETAIPLIENWYQELLDDANAIENIGERTEAIAALGSPEAFVANLRSQYVTPVITGIERSREALETRTATRLANEALGALREAASDTNVTEAEILALWQTAIPLIETWYQELLDDAEAIEGDAARAEAIAALGSPEQFVANLKSQYVTPVITGIQRSQEALETRTANREAQQALRGLRELAGDVNVTEQAIADAWTAALPFIETWYQELLDDANAIENDAARVDAIDALGSPEAFVANLKSQYVTPVLTGIAQSTEALQTRTANREAQTAIQSLRDVAEDVNVTEQAIVDKWQEAIPFIQTWWQELYDDIVNNENLNDAEIRESLAELGSVEAFVGNIRSQYVTPVLNNILGTQFQNRSNAAQNRVNRTQFNLGGATSESDFETRRGLVIAALNAYYDAEEERIDNLEVSEADLQDLRDDNDLARDRALQQATTATNRFAEERIRTEEQIQADIADLRDDALANEADRQQKLIDLEQDTQDRILDIQRKAIQSREDVEREFQRDTQDRIRDYTLAFGEILDDTSLSGSERQEAIVELDRENSELARTQGFDRLRDLEDIGIREGRRVSDVERTSGDREQDIIRQAEQEALALRDVLAPLLEQQGNPPAANEAETTTAENSTGIAESTQATADAQPAIMAELEPISEIRDIEQQILQTLGLSLAAHTRAGVNLEALVNATFRGATARERLIEEIEGFGAVLPDAVAVAIAASTTTEPAVQTEINELLELTRPQLPNNLRQDIINDIIQPTRADVPMRDITNLTQRIGAAEALSATREVPTSFTADTVNVSGSVVNVSGGNRSGSRESETPQSRFPVESDELRAEITLEFPDGTIQEINNQMLRLKQQDRA